MKCIHNTEVVSVNPFARGCYISRTIQRIFIILSMVVYTKNLSEGYNLIPKVQYNVIFTRISHQILKNCTKGCRVLLVLYSTTL
jgi:hypothetical protein